MGRSWREAEKGREERKRMGEVKGGKHDTSH